jgi:hypothetical protein
MDRQTWQGEEIAMLVKNYREVKAQPVVEEPGVSARRLRTGGGQG